MARLYTRRELQARTRREDAALVIDNVVYDVARFLDEHPGGAEVLLDNAGGDASKCFRDVGHSDEARLLRARFQIGELVEEDRREPLCAPPESEAADERSLRGLLDAATPPLVLAALAVLIYVYLF